MSNKCQLQENLIHLSSSAEGFYSTKLKLTFQPVLHCVHSFSLKNKALKASLTLVLKFL